MIILIVQKRDGRKVQFDKEKIKMAVLKAFIEVDREKTDTKSLRKALKLLKDNENIRFLIFPEGKVLKDKKQRGVVKMEQYI